MALIVRVYINERMIIETHAQRIKGQPHERCTYKNEAGEVLDHHYDDGAEALAIALLWRHRRRLLNDTHQQTDPELHRTD